ncbi:MAG: hypothetical protein FJ286_06590 [Planctomycetes bacterium]|nr:hypothetical protein [Planctomycetota bacterium]
MFFRTFKELLGCRHLFSCDHNGVEIRAWCAMIVCMLILISTDGKPEASVQRGGTGGPAAGAGIRAPGDG